MILYVICYIYRKNIWYFIYLLLGNMPTYVIIYLIIYLSIPRLYYVII